jgi:hypothetical protein
VKKFVNRALLMVAVALSVAVLCSCVSPGGSIKLNSTDDTPWQIVTYDWSTGEQVIYTVGVDNYPWGAGTLSDGVWLTFPTYKDSNEASNGASVVRLRKLYTDRPRSLSGDDAISISLSMTADDKTEIFWHTQPSNTCKTPASVRPFFDGWYQGPYEPTYDWWSSTASYALAPGSASLQAALTPSQWSDENGHTASYNQATIDGFDFSMKTTQSIGLSFGGGCFYGHGVSTIAGNARFELHAFQPAPD